MSVFDHVNKKPCFSSLSLSIMTTIESRLASLRFWNEREEDFDANLLKISVI